MDNLEQTITENYLEVLQPSEETINTVKAVGTAVVDATQESFDKFESAKSEAKQQGNSDNFQLDANLALAKGAIQGVGGIIGDLEKLASGVVAVAKTPKGKLKLIALGKALQQDSFFTNSEDMAKHLSSLGWTSEESMGFVEGLGEILSPIGTAIKGVSKISKVAKTTMKNAKNARVKYDAQGKRI
jgi:hypothetical protein